MDENGEEWRGRVSEIKQSRFNGNAEKLMRLSDMDEISEINRN